MKNRTQILYGLAVSSILLSISIHSACACQKISFEAYGYATQGHGLDRDDAAVAEAALKVALDPKTGQCGEEATKLCRDEGKKCVDVEIHTTFLSFSDGFGPELSRCTDYMSDSGFGTGARACFVTLDAVCKR